MISIAYIVKNLCKLVRWKYPRYDSFKVSYPSSEQLFHSASHSWEKLQQTHSNITCIIFPSQIMRGVSVCLNSASQLCIRRHQFQLWTWWWSKRWLPTNDQQESLQQIQGSERELMSISGTGDLVQGLWWGFRRERSKESLLLAWRCWFKVCGTGSLVLLLTLCHLQFTAERVPLVTPLNLM